MAAESLRTALSLDGLPQRRTATGPAALRPALPGTAAQDDLGRRSNLMAPHSLRPKTDIVHWIGGCFLAAVILLHLGLVGLGQWLADEYDDFGRLERDGWSFLWDRLKWSPRPFSEFLC